MARRASDIFFDLSGGALLVHRPESAAHRLENGAMPTIFP
jgi:hypothetical protein